VTGGCIAAAATLSLGGVPARSVSAPDSTALVGMTPRHVPATVDAVLTNPDGQIATLPSSYTYLAGNGAYPLTPCRVLDTRGPIGLTGGPALPSRTWRAFPISGSCGVPQGAVAIMVNAAVTSPTAPGTINIGGSDILAFSAGQTRSNNGFVMLDEFGSVYFLNTSSGTADVILDVTGYFR
jgi:hypothetical protein